MHRRRGFAPQIDGLRDNVTGLPQIERGSETGAVEIYGAGKWN
jgi:hypothetical protein